MSVLVIGGAGYIGSATVECLVAKGEQVVVLDNLTRGHRAAVPPEATLIQGEMADGPLVGRLIADHGIDAAMHFAAHSQVGESVQNPLLYWENNVQSGIALLQTLVEGGVKHFIFSSTAAVYGEPEEMPITEETPKAPTNPYGQTKLTFERILADADAAHGLKSVCLRYFNAAGATASRGEDHTPETHLIPLVLQVALGQREAIKVFGDDYPTRDGTCVRDYIHILDLAEAHILALQHLRGGGESQAFNLGNGEGITVREIIEIAREVTGHPIPAETASRRAGDPPTLIASAQRARETLGWAPERGSVREIVQSAWDWHRVSPEGYSGR